MYIPTPVRVSLHSACVNSIFNVCTVVFSSQMRRPGSSRPAPPRVLRHQVSQDPSAGISGSVSLEGGAVARVILDTDKGDEEDDGNFITEEVPVMDAMNQVWVMWM